MKPRTKCGAQLRITSLSRTSAVVPYTIHLGIWRHMMPIPFQIVVHDQDLIRQGGKLVTEQMDTETLQITTTEAMVVRFRQFLLPRVAGVS